MGARFAHRLGIWSAAIGIASLGALSASVPGRAAEIQSAATVSPMEAGMASYFSTEMAGARTANGERCDPDTLTAAHRTLPFGSKVLVTDPSTGRSVVVRINDRGPFARARVIDLSRAAATELGIVKRGSARVELRLLSENNRDQTAL